MSRETCAELKCRLATASDRYDRLVSVSNAQVSTVNDLRDALLHLAQRTHPHSDGCAGCRKVQEQLRIATKEPV